MDSLRTRVLTYPAASDRRPVDPPPVIELKIYEGKWEDQKEITFDYNANFFLFASLQQARPIAHGRGMAPPPSTSPVLTGVPVAGMAYLDRPTAAGYFIFPDLSVRHEGNFKLTFSLYETTKEEKDLDRDPACAEDQQFAGVDWKMEVSTKPFSVFSAKKFPGLMESTHLSKTVADQGCRVRIRRDVRMRKRDGKGGSNARRSEDEPHRQRTVTPATEDPRVRARSATGTSDNQGPYYGERRPSATESYPPPPPRPAPPHDSASTSHGHLAFGESSTHHYATPRPHTQLPSASPSRPYMQSPRPKPEPFYHSSRPGSESSLPSLAAIKPNDYHHRQASSSTVAGSPTTFGPSDPFLRPSLNGSSAQLAAPRPTLPPIQPGREFSSNKMKIHQLVSPSSPPIEAQAEPLAPPPPIPIGGKRKHEDTFSQNSTPLHNGQRQADAHHNKAKPNAESGSYYRADGRLASVQFNKWE